MRSQGLDIIFNGESSDIVLEIGCTVRIQ